MGFNERIEFHLNLKRCEGISNSVSGKRVFQAEGACLACLKKRMEVLCLGKTDRGDTKRKESWIGYQTL